MRHGHPFGWLPLAAFLVAGGGIVSKAELGPPVFSKAKDDPANIFDAPIPGFVGPSGEGNVTSDNTLNPLFFGWGNSVISYFRADSASLFNNPALALGPVTGDAFNVVALGEPSAAALASGAPPGNITIDLAKPISNKPGADFAVFENGLLAQFDNGGAGVGNIFGELAFVEVSSDGTHFARFPSKSITKSPVPAYGTLDATKILNLAGKHANGYGISWGTPFDLDSLATDPLVGNGTVDLDTIRYVRIVDTPGNGTSVDSEGGPIYDPSPTIGSGGFDLEAIGAISVDTTFEEWQTLRGLSGDQRGPRADPERDLNENLLEYAFALLPLAPDRDGLPRAFLAPAGAAISFRRDTRAVDLIYEVQASDDMKTWKTIARSVAGGPLVPVPPSAPIIYEASDSPISSVGVIRRATVADTTGSAQIYFRVQIIYQP